MKSQKKYPFSILPVLFKKFQEDGRAVAAFKEAKKREMKRLKPNCFNVYGRENWLL